jgi:hypothetical protein
MVRRLNRHRLTEQNHKLQSCEEPSLAVIILSLRVLKVRAKLLSRRRGERSQNRSPARGAVLMK